MNFDFNDEQKQLRDQTRRFLEENCDTTKVRAVLEGKDRYDRALWKGLAELGLIGVAISEEFGGAGAGHLELCVVAEELGRALAPVPFASTVYLAAEILGRHGSQAQKQQWLPAVAAGDAVGCLAFSEGVGDPSPASIGAQVADGRLTGVKTLVADGGVADFAIVAARAGAGAETLSLWLVDLSGPGVTRADVETIDPSRNHADIEFSGAPAQLIGEAGEGWALLGSALDRAAVLLAFEQVGGADRALYMARDYALDRMAFGRQIGSFQAVKHILADMYVAATLARSNAYYGAWALAADAGELAEAAANARVSATQAFQLCARQNNQVHGGMGFTWESDCHLFYRRSALLALTIGSLPWWEDRLVENMRRRNAA